MSIVRYYSEYQVVVFQWTPISKHTVDVHTNAQYGSMSDDFNRYKNNF